MCCCTQQLKTRIYVSILHYDLDLFNPNPTLEEPMK